MLDLLLADVTAGPLAEVCILQCPLVLLYCFVLVINICKKQKPIFLGLPKTPIFNFPDTLSRPTFKIITYASRALTDVEKRYGPIEREFLAIQYGCFRSEIYLLGKDFEVITDHKPLVSLYNSPRCPGPFRVERMRPKLQGK